MVSAFQTIALISLQQTFSAPDMEAANAFCVAGPVDLNLVSLILSEGSGSHMFMSRKME